MSRRFFSTGGIGWYLIIGALAYAFVRGRSALAGTLYDPLTGLPITRTSESGPVPPYTTLLPIRTSVQGGGFI